MHTMLQGMQLHLEACIGVLGIFAILLPGICDTTHFTSRDMGHCVQYFCFTLSDIRYLGKIIMGIFAL